MENLRPLVAGLLTMVSLATAAQSRQDQEQQNLSGSERIRMERCAGDYVCDDDGSWVQVTGDHQMAQAPRLPRSVAAICADRDLQAIWILERSSEDPNADSGRLIEAAKLLHAARAAGTKDETQEAIAFYDRLLSGILVIARTR